MNYHRLLKGRLQSEEAVVDGCGIASVGGDHVGSRFTVADDFERIRLNSMDDGVGDSRGRLAWKAKLRARAVGLHHRRIGVAGVGGEDMNGERATPAPANGHH